jgi:ABC-2 type transport system permease protein
MWVRLFAIVRKEFIHVIRDPRTLAVMCIMPIMQLLLLGFATNTDVRDIPMGILDLDHSQQSRALVNAYVISGQFAIAHQAATDDELTRLMDSGGISSALVIPPNYGRDLQAGKSVSVAFYIDGSDPSTATSALSSAVLIGQSVSSNVQFERLERNGMRNIGMPLEVRTRVWYNPDMLSAYFMIPGLIGLILQMQITMLTANAIVREREYGTIEQLIVTPIQPFELMLGKTLPYMLVAFLLIVEVLTVGRFVFGVPIRGSIVMLLLASLLFLFTVLGIGLLISSMANTQQEAMLLTMATILPSVFLSGFLYPLSSLPVVFQWLSKAIPLTYFLEIVRSVMLKGTSVFEFSEHLIFLAISAVVFLTLASLRFKKRLD